MYSASTRVAPSAKPSKDWWNTRAAARGRMVHGLGDTPSAMPIKTLHHERSLSSMVASQ